MASAETTAVLEPTSPEVKRYQRLKLTAGVVATAVELAFLASMAFGWGAALGDALSAWLGDRGWLLLIAVAAVVAVGSELLTLPLAFWSGYILEHRFQLSNQTVAAWLWKRVKGYLVAAFSGCCSSWVFTGFCGPRDGHGGCGRLRDGCWSRLSSAGSCPS